MNTAQITWLETLILNAIQTQQQKDYFPRIYWWHVECAAESAINKISDSIQRNRVYHAFHQNKLDIMRGLQDQGRINWEMEGSDAVFSIA
jgi:hypothetical protein